VKYSVITFGCRVNQADSLGFEEELLARGGVTAAPEHADVVLQAHVQRVERKRTAHEPELHCAPVAQDAQRHRASRAAEDPADRLPERERRRRCAVDGQDRVAGEDSRHPRGAVHRPAHEQAPRCRQNRDPDPPVAARERAARHPVLGRREIRRVAVVQAAQEAGDRRLREVGLRQAAVVVRRELAAHLVDLRLMPCRMRDRAQGKPDPEGCQRRCRQGEDHRVPHDGRSLSDRPVGG